MNELLLLATTATSNPADLKMWAYWAFIGLVVVFLALDLGVFHREAHEVAMKEAVTWSAIWLTCGIVFSGFVYLAYENHWLGLGLDTAKYSTSEAIKAGAPLIVSGEVQADEVLANAQSSSAVASAKVSALRSSETMGRLPLRSAAATIVWPACSV